MKVLYTTRIGTPFGEKEIGVRCGDVMEFGEDIDILTTSAHVNSYAPIPGTLFRALSEWGIFVDRLAADPQIDLRKSCHTWLSREVLGSYTGIHRIGCVEFMSSQLLSGEDNHAEQAMLNSIRAYFAMLDIAAIYDVKMDTVVLPLLGSGRQHISVQLVIVPLLNECLAFLKRNREVKRIWFVERSQEKAQLIADYMRRSYSILTRNQEQPLKEPAKPTATAFISYASPDKNIADNLCAKLEQRGIRVWYAPRDVRGPYAEAIAKAIDQCTHFVVILSQNSMQSQHVLNEIDLAFQDLPNNIKFKPLRIDESIFTPSFKYYLSRQHWMDAMIPPLEDRLNEFADKLLADM